MSVDNKRGTYLIEFFDGSKFIFGSNYKPWWQHATEYIYREYGNKEHGWLFEDVKHAVLSVSYSNQPFYDDGGLKWCGVEAYQEVIDDVCKKEKLAHVRFEKIIFEESPADKSVLTRKLKIY